MKTKRRKSAARKYKNLALLVVGFGMVGALFSYRAFGLSASSSISGVSSMSKNAAAVTQKDTTLNIAVSSGSNPNKTPVQPSSPPAVPAPSSTAKATVKRSPAKTTPVAAPPPAPVGSDIAPESACPGQGNVSAAKTVLVCMTSYARGAHGLSGVSANSKLMSAADSKAQDIINCSFSHTACGHPFDYWFTFYGYACGNRAENIAEGQKMPLEVFTAWMNSAGHRANILNGVYKDEGTAVASSSNGIVWVMELGGC